MIKKHCLSKPLIIMIVMVFCSFFSEIQAQNRDDEHPFNLPQKGFKKSILKTSLGEVALFEAGTGEPLLLLHGVGAGASSYLWFKLAPELAKSYRVIAPDFIGWGESYRPDRDLLFEDYVQQIQEIGKYIGEPTRIIAQSLSTGFVLEAIKSDGIEVNQLVLFTPSGGKDFGVDAFDKGATDFFKGIADSPKRKENYARLFHQKPAVENWWRSEGFLKGDAVPEEIIEANFYNAKQKNASFSALPFLSGSLRYDIAPLLKNLDVPAIMLWGDGEFRIQPTVQSQISAVNEKIKVYRIENARSAFDIEQPEQTLNIVNKFFNSL